MVRCRITNLLLLVFSSCVALIIAEVLLGWYLPARDRFLVWPPNLRQRFQPSEISFPGIHGDSWFSTNSEGIRGEEMPSDADHYLLAVGGSATECLYLDNTETWPALLTNNVHKATGERYWIGNIGQSGRSARHNLQQIRYLTAQYPAVRTVVLLAGVNDLLFRLLRGPGFTPLEVDSEQFNRETIGHSFTYYPDKLRFATYDPNRGFLKRSALWSALRLLKDQWLRAAPRENVLIYQDERGAGLQSARAQRRQSGPFINDLPNLSTALSEFRTLIIEIIRICKERNVRLILMTQPTLWSSMSSEELFWSGRASDGRYYSAAALTRGMAAYNAALKALALEHGITLIDLEAALSGDTSAFYDDMHFNERGAAKVATLVSKALGYEIYR